tara:strand:- start:11178 stop:13277 length:2100 start_codon:yes stop_codon:yes gene_type:complete
MPISYPKNKEDQLAFWTRRIEHAIEYWRPVFEPSQVLIDMYNNDPATTRERELQRLNIGDYKDPGIRSKANIVFGHIDQSIANMAAHNPTFSVTPMSRAGIGSERVVSKISNYWYRETSQLRHDKRVLLDSYLSPFGAKKLGYKADIEARMISDKLLNAGQVINNPYDESLYLLSGEQTVVLQDQNHVAHIETHTNFLQQPDVTEQQAAILQLHIEDHQYYLDHSDPHRNTSIKWECPFGLHWNAGDVLIDPLAADGLHDARWVAFRTVRHIDEVLYDDALDTRDLEPNHRIAGAPDTEPDTFTTDDFGLVESYEIYARNHIVNSNTKENLWLEIAPYHDRFLKYENEWPVQSLEDYPLEILSLQDGINTWFTKGPLIMGGADSMQSMVNEILDSYISVIRKQKNLFLYDPMYIREEEIDAILEAEDMEAFEVEGLVQAQGRAVQAIQFGDIPPEKGDILRLVQSMFDRANGTPQPISLPRTDSATEANIHDRRTTAREDERAQKFAQYQVRVARKFWQMTTEFRPERLFLIDPKAVEEVKITEEMSSGEYAFEIDVSSASTALAVERKQHLDLISLMQNLNQLLMQQNNGVGPNIGELVKDLLIRGYRIPDPERILPFLSMDDDIGNQIEDVINPAATEGDGGLTQEQVIQQLMQGGQPQQGRDIRTQPVPRESAIQGDAMKASEGSGVDSLRQTGDG